MRIGVLMGLWALMVFAGSASAANEYPSKPIRVVVDQAPGGVIDIWARRLAPHISKSLGQPVLIDNKPGASGTLAPEEVAKSAPDGYTVLLAGMSGIIVYPVAGGVVKYDPATAFSSAAINSMGYALIAVNSATGVRSVAELMSYAKTVPDGLTCGTAGNAGVYHFACATVSRALGIPFRMIPYKSNSAAMQDAAGGQIQLVTGFPAEIAALISSGRLTPLAVIKKSNVRLPQYPGVPTMEEAGYPDTELLSFNAFHFPANTPQDIVSKFSQASNAAMRQPESVEALRLSGSEHRPLSPAELSSFIAAQRAKWKRISDEMGIKAEQ
jgi:tripartite-type tricarboxylate transporter receptor subunit TctC